MAKYIGYCPYCDGKNLTGLKDNKKDFCDGYFNVMSSDTCSTCNRPAEKTNITFEEFRTIEIASNENRQFLNAMRELKDRDIIEYELKMSQLRSNASKIQKTAQEQPRVDDRIKCPKCGSISITTGARGANGFWGFIGASKTVNRCGKCGYTWKP